jgi:alpha-L-fucosidase
VVNDRFMPRSPVWKLAQSKVGRQLLDRYAARKAMADRGIVPPKPPLFDVRTPEYTAFDSVQRTPWECVRGMDRSFGYNRESGEEQFISERDLLWSLTDIAAKGGNLLLNVGPRGMDATIADDQLCRLGWLADYTDEVGDAIVATRPWVHPAGSAEGGIEVRYTARDRLVFAFLRLTSPLPDNPDSPAEASHTHVVLHEIHAIAASTVSLMNGQRLNFEPTAEGLRVELITPLSSERPVVIVLRDVDAR